MAQPTSSGHSRGFHVASWAGAVATIVAGIYLSHIRFMGIEWLSRAGCLVVMLGIWSGIGGIVQERVLSNRTKWRRRNAIIAAKARIAEMEIDPDQAKAELDELNAAFDSQLSESTQRHRLSIGTLEVSLLMIGTFLWGFGDLLAR